jgi:probable HAF family extracellular repeat protein
MRRSAFFLGWLLVFGIGLSAQSQTYKFSSPSGPQLSPAAINDSGSTAGSFCCGATNDIYDFPPMSYVYTSDLGFNVILPPQGLHNGSYVSGINNGAKVVGGYTDNSFRSRGFSFDTTVGIFKTLDYPGALSTSAAGINDANLIVGTFCTTKSACGGNVSAGAHGFSFLNGNATQIDYPGALATGCNSVNNNGDIVGIYSSGTQLKGFLYSKGVFTTIDPAPSLYSVATGINDLGEIVGTYLDPSNKTHGFVYKAGVYTTFDVPGALGTELSGVNRSGTLVGIEIIPKGAVTASKAFIATPQ